MFWFLLQDGVCRFHHTFGQPGFQIVLPQRNQRCGMSRIKSGGFLIELNRIAPVLFLLLNMSKEDIGIRILRVYLQHIPQGHSRLGIIRRLNVLIGASKILCLPFFGAATRGPCGRRQKNDGDLHARTESPRTSVVLKCRWCHGARLLRNLVRYNKIRIPSPKRIQSETSPNCRT
jgi:hypothetical protein